MKDSSKHQSKNKKRTETDEHIQGAGNMDRSTAAPTRGGISDMDNRSIRDAAGNKAAQTRGSGMSTKNTVTGSDFDGQLSDQ